MCLQFTRLHVISMTSHYLFLPMCIILFSVKVPGCIGCQKGPNRSLRRSAYRWSAPASQFQVPVWLCGPGSLSLSIYNLLSRYSKLSQWPLWNAVFYEHDEVYTMSPYTAYNGRQHYNTTTQYTVQHRGFWVSLKCSCVCCLQDDVVMGTLTVRENLRFSAALRLPSSVSQREKEMRVNSLIKELGLSKVADSKVRIAYFIFFFFLVVSLVTFLMMTSSFCWEVNRLNYQYRNNQILP